MFQELKDINTRPLPFQFYTADALWTDEHTAQQMLQYHLNESINVASRKRDFIERSVKWMAARFDMDDKTEIADFGCGPGLYANRLAAVGAKVTGIDFSKNSLDYARKTAAQKGLAVNYIHSNYLDFTIDRKFDLIIMIMCDFCALSPDQRKRLLSGFSSILKPGGSVLLDVYSLNSFDQKQESATYELNQLNGFWSPNDYYCFVNSYKYEDEKVALDKYTIIEETRTHIVYNWLQYFSPESLTAEFDTNGFEVDTLLSDVAGTPFDAASLEFAVVAKKS